MAFVSRGMATRNFSHFCKKIFGFRMYIRILERILSGSHVHVALTTVTRRMDSSLLPRPPPRPRAIQGINEESMSSPFWSLSPSYQGYAPSRPRPSAHAVQNEATQARPKLKKQPFPKPLPDVIPKSSSPSPRKCTRQP